MKLNVHVEAARLMRTLREVQPVLKKEGKALVRAGARLATRKAMEMTPPFDARNFDNKLDSGSLEARRRGEAAIKGDAFGGSRGKTKRSGIFFVANESLLKKFHANHPAGQVEKLFVRKDGTVWATESRYYAPGASTADMDAHHARYWSNGRMSSGGARDRSIGRWKFIDRMVVGKGSQSRWLKARYRRIGWLAAGWLNAASELKVPRVPAWIKRHSNAPGAIRFSDADGTFKIYIVNAVKFGRSAQLERVVPYALRAASNGMKAQARHTALRAMKRAGFTLSSASLAAA